MGDGEVRCKRCGNTGPTRERETHDGTEWMQPPRGWWMRTDQRPLITQEWLCRECVEYLDSDENK
jgi:hypothetical protein